MKKLTKSVLAVVLSASFSVTYAQKAKVDTAGTKDIEGVVVTALGIKREKKSLGYASQELKAEALTDGTTKTGNVAQLLSGKAAGVQVNTNNNFGGSTNIVIRGIKQLAGNGGSPLIVIDGSPINNASLSGTYDYGNFLSDLNPDDIESMNILKGAAASALYGERALNGVVVIETKKGRSGRKENSWGVTLTSDVNVGFVDKSTFPEYQKRYGAGYGPYYSSPDGYFEVNGDGTYEVVYGEDASYGAEFDPNLLVYQWDAWDPTSPNFGKATPWVAAKNGPITYFENPTSFVNSVALEKSNGKNNFLLNFSNFDQSGLMPNSKLRKNLLSARVNYALSEKLTASVYTTLTVQDTRGRNITGYSDNVVTGFRQWWQTNVDIQDQKAAYFRTKQNITWNRISAADGYPLYWNNPYFQAYENYQSDSRNRTFSYGQLKYDFNKNFGLLAKVSYDYYDMTIEERLAMGSLLQAFGNSGENADSGYSKQSIKSSETNFDLIGNYKFDLTDNINVSGIVGGNVRRNMMQNDYASTEGGLIVPGLYALSNSKGSVLPTDEYFAKSATASAYASASFDFYKTFYLDGTYRADKSSNLKKGNNVYDYYSVTGALLLNQFVKNDNINFWKLRANYAVVGGSTTNYRTTPLLYSYSGSFSGNPLFGIPNSIGNPDLLPERSKEVEVGMELKMFNNRLGLDVALYKTNTFNQIIPVDVSTSTGMYSVIRNAGEFVNKGIEVQLNVVPVRTKSFEWNVDLNWAKNENEVVKLIDGLSVYRLGGYQGGVSLNAFEGKEYGALLGTDYVYHENGQRIIDPNTGRYLRTAESNKVIGNITPDWVGGIRNSFSYKNLSAGFLIDVQHGGDTFSTDMYYGLATGLYAETAVGDYRTAGVVHPGVNPNGNVNTTATISPEYYGNVDGYRRMPNARFVYDTSYVKLREANITYKLPQSILAGTFMEEVKFSVVGRNLWIIHKNLPYADPEAGTGGGLASKGNSIGVLPTTRDLGFSVSIKF